LNGAGEGQAGHGERAPAYGSEELQRHNAAHAKAGDVVLLGSAPRVGLEALGVTAEQATLTRRQADGLWWAALDGGEWCIGSGYDWKVVA